MLLCLGCNLYLYVCVWAVTSTCHCVSLQAVKLRTRTIHKTLNPVWNEKLVYHGISADDMRAKTLRVSVLDEDRFGFDFIGEYRTALKFLKHDQTRSFNVLLDKHVVVGLRVSAGFCAAVCTYDELCLRIV